MKDVAKEAGVSQACVSLVLNEKDTGNITEETKARIFEVCKKLGYRKNRLAGTIHKNGRSGIIGIIADGLLLIDFAHSIILGAQAAATENSKTLMIVSIDSASKKFETTATQTILDYRAEGIIYATSFLRGVALPPTLYSEPLVLVNCFTNTREVTSILPDDYIGLKKAMEYLLSKGHRNITYFSNSLTIASEIIPATKLREKAFLETVKEHNLADATIIRMDITREAIVAEVNRLLALENRPTAILCYNDRMALAVTTCLQQSGLRVPEDISVVGYDNQEVIVDYLSPKLVTVSLPHYEMGYNSIKKLLDTIDGKEATEMLVEPILIEGNSVKEV